MKTPATRLALLALALTITGCASLLAPQPDRSRFFVLSSGAKASSTAPGASHLALGVGPVTIPDYLQRPGIATRVGPTEVDYSQTDRWAEPLEECLPRVLAQDLSDSLGTSRVVMFPWAGDTHVDYQVQVNVERFELTSQGQAVLAARWTIRNPQTGEILDSGEANESRRAGSDAASATAALSQALDAMARDLASRISQLSRKAGPSERKESAATPASRLQSAGID
jgi:uncharacterized lipoprotein YmbA